MYRQEAKDEIDAVPVPRHHGHCSLVRVEMFTLQIGTISPGTAVAIVEDHPGGSRRRRIGAVHQHRPLIDVGMAREDEIHPVALQDRHHDFPHFDQLVLHVTVVGSFRVGRVVPEGDQPL